jgi:hypothetical protein
MNPLRIVGWRRRRFLATSAALDLGCAARIHGKKAPAANPVLLWNEGFIKWVRAQTPPPALAARNLGILHLALHRVAVRAAVVIGNDPLPGPESQKSQPTAARCLFIPGQTRMGCAIPALATRTWAKFAGSPRSPGESLRP